MAQMGLVQTISMYNFYGQNELHEGLNHRLLHSRNISHETSEKLLETVAAFK